jgi:hypothetical protein
MPNHVTTRCVITGQSEALARFLETHIRPDSDADPRLDFNTIIPMPDCLKGTISGGFVDIGIEVLTGKPSPFRSGSLLDQVPEDQRSPEKLRAWIEKNRPGAIAEAEKALFAYEQTGFRDWYEWSLAHWDTKWNAYSFAFVFKNGPERVEFTFDTAWSFPSPIFAKLAEMYPELVFDCACFDEGHFFAGAGQFNGDNDFAICDPDAAIYERVYGHEMPTFGDEEEVG